jgi:hypothetical protein
MRASLYHSSFYIGFQAPDSLKVRACGSARGRLAAAHVVRRI